jgi:Cu/Ag efflux protein CusF
MFDVKEKETVQMRQSNRVVVAAAAAALLVAPSIIGTSPGGAAWAQAAASSTDSEVITSTSVVTAIDPATRTVTIKFSNGKTMDVKAGDNVRNFAQIKVGDRIVATLELALTYTVFPIGTKLPAAMVVDRVGRAKPGAEPGAVVSRSASLSGLIVGVDAVAHTVSVVEQGGGPVHILQVKNPERQAYLPKVHPGQILAITYTEALALQVEPAS